MPIGFIVRGRTCMLFCTLNEVWDNRGDGEICGCHPTLWLDDYDAVAGRPGGRWTLPVLLNCATLNCKVGLKCVRGIVRQAKVGMTT